MEPFYDELEKLGWHRKLAALTTATKLVNSGNYAAALAEVLRNPKALTRAHGLFKGLDLSKYPHLRGAPVPDVLPTGRFAPIKIGKSGLEISNWLRRQSSGPQSDRFKTDALKAFRDATGS